jgi:hypothetical protein
MAYGLTQPRGLGETGTTAAIRSLMQGYQGMALATELARQRQLEEQKARIEAAKAAAEIAKTGAETGKIQAETEVAKAQPEAVRSEAQLRKAQAKKAEVEASVAPKLAEADLTRALASQAQAKIAESKLAFDRAEAERKAEFALRELDLQERRLQELSRSNQADERVQRERNALLKQRNEAYNKYMEAMATKLAHDAKMGDWEKVQFEAIKAYLESNPSMPNETSEEKRKRLDEAFEFGKSVVNQLKGSVQTQATGGGKRVKYSEVKRAAEETGTPLKEAVDKVLSAGYQIDYDEK